VVSIETCPRCGGKAVMADKCLGRWQLGRASRFEPDGLRRFQPFRFRQSGIPLQAGFTACLACGLVWSGVAPDELRALVERHGTEATKAQLPPEGST
jgi:hypothetical protein